MTTFPLDANIRDKAHSEEFTWDRWQVACSGRTWVTDHVLPKPTYYSDLDACHSELTLLLWGVTPAIPTTSLTNLKKLVLKGDNAVLKSDKDGALRCLLNQLTSVEFSVVGREFWPRWGSPVESQTLVSASILDARDMMLPDEINPLPPLHFPYLQKVRISPKVHTLCCACDWPTHILGYSRPWERYNKACKTLLLPTFSVV
jgi:hypothetical protein